MKKGLLILLLSLIGSIGFAQGTAPKEEEKPKPAKQQENPAPVQKIETAEEVVKAVPAAKEGAKPQRVVTNRKNKKPTVVRPARRPGTVVRPVRPGRGR